MKLVTYISSLIEILQKTDEYVKLLSKSDQSNYKANLSSIIEHYCHKGRLGLFRFLFEKLEEAKHDEYYEIRSRKYYTIANKRGHLHIIKYLESKCVRCDNEQIRTACIEGNIDHVKYFFDNKIYIFSDEKESYFKDACLNSSYDIIEFLIDNSSKQLQIPYIQKGNKIQTISDPYVFELLLERGCVDNLNEDIKTKFVCKLKQYYVKVFNVIDKRLYRVLANIITRYAVTNKVVIYKN
jgi:hypothetical protein